MSCIQFKLIWVQLNVSCKVGSSPKLVVLRTYGINYRLLHTILLKCPTFLFAQTKKLEQNRHDILTFYDDKKVCLKVMFHGTVRNSDF